MSRKTILILLVGVLIVASVAAFVKPDRKNWVIKQRIAGSIFTNIEVATEPFDTRTLLNLIAKGSPGKAHIEGVGSAMPAAEESELCPDGTELELEFVDGGFVETFNDHSLLFAVVDVSPDAKNALCIDFD